MALFIEIKAADGLVSRTRLEAGKNRFTVRLGDSYQIIDDQTGLTPAGIAVKRIDNNLIVDGLDAVGSPRETSVEFAEFYSVCSAGSPCELTVDNGSGSAPVAITPGTQPIGALADGSFVLYDPNFADTAPPAPSMGDGTALRNVLYGVGGLAVIGLAAGGGGGGGDNDGGGRPDGSLKLTSSQFVNSRTPTFSGEGEPGARVTVRIDTNNDGTPDATYVTTVGNDFLWNINLGTAVPESGALPPGGLPDASNVSVTSTAGGVNTSLPTFVLAYDGTPPAVPAINPVATDNVVNAGEKQNGIVISGTAEPGSTVILSLNGKVLASVPVSASGQWQTQPPIPGASLPGNGDYVLTAVAQDSAGNLSVGAEAKVSIDTAPPQFSGLQIAGGDSIVAIADAAAVNFSGRTDPGAVVQVQWSGGSKTATAAGNGNWTLDFTGVEVPNSAGADFPYTLTATNAIGNTIVQPGQVRVDRQAPGAPVIAPVEGDNTVTLLERADGIPVTGSGEAGAQVQVSWGSTTRTATVDGNNQWAVNFAPGELPAVPSPGGPTTLTATLVDAVGNSSSAQASVTVLQPFPAPTIGSVTSDNIVNAAEAGAGVVLSGALQAGAAGIDITWGGFSGAGTIAGQNWTLNVPSASIPADGLTTMTATLTGVGGGASGTSQVTVDRAPPAAPVVGPVAGDDVISVVERIGGVTIQGTTEVGTSVSVALGTAAKFAVVTGTSWTVSFTEAELPNGPLLTTIPTAMSVSAYDAAGNPSAPTARVIGVQGSQLGPPLDAAVAEEPPSPLALPELLAAGAGGTLGLQGSDASYLNSSATLNSLLREEGQSSGLLA